ncbi:MAG: acetoacetate decarboxylase family protein [Actinobacteria bacterium]|nr:acetoacetate decarboxylase family protein [Actinomycetota bacterium]
MKTSKFFEGVRQAEIDLRGDLVKLPIFYRDGESMSGVFPARLSRLRRYLPDRRLEPARLAPGVGAVSIACFEYRDSDVGSYNELAIAIALNYPHHRVNLPARAMLGGALRGQIDGYVWHLPVTTELALKAGRELWNYPKFVAPIEFEQDAVTRTCRLSDQGERILTMRTRRIESDRSETTQLFTHVFQDGQPQRGEFKLRQQNSGQSLKPGTSVLELGDRHPIARELEDVLLSTRSVAAAYSPSMQGILFGPENVSSHFIQMASSTEAGGGSDNGKSSRVRAKNAVGSP